MPQKKTIPLTVFFKNTWPSPGTSQEINKIKYGFIACSIAQVARKNKQHKSSTYPGGYDLSVPVGGVGGRPYFKYQ